MLAKVLVPLYYKYGCTTTTELLEHRFGDAGIRAGVGLLFLFGYQFILLPVVLYTGAVFMKSMFCSPWRDWPMRPSVASARSRSPTPSTASACW